MRILNLSRVSFNEVHKFGVFFRNVTSQKPERPSRHVYNSSPRKYAIGVKPNSLPVQLNTNLILIYFSIADYYFLIINVCV